MFFMVVVIVVVVAVVAVVGVVAVGYSKVYRTNGEQADMSSLMQASK